MIVPIRCLLSCFIGALVAAPAYAGGGPLPVTVHAVGPQIPKPEVKPGVTTRASVELGVKKGAGIGDDSGAAGGDCQPDCSKLNVECLNPSPDYDNRTFVGRILNGGADWCTGWIVATDGNQSVIMTNQHCTVGQDVTDFRILFNDECDACMGGGPKSTISFPINGLITQNAELDYALLRVGGDPAATWGVAEIDDAPCKVGMEVYEIHHADSLRKGYDAGTVLQCAVPACVNNEIAVSNLVASGGASGSPIFRSDNHCVTAICNCGPDCKDGFGVPMSNIIPDAEPALQAAGFRFTFCGMSGDCPFEESGLLVQGTDCLLLRTENGDLIALVPPVDNTGGFQVGDRVKVEGDVQLGNDDCEEGICPVVGAVLTAPDCPTDFQFRVNFRDVPKGDEVLNPTIGVGTGCCDRNAMVVSWSGRPEVCCLAGQTGDPVRFFTWQVWLRRFEPNGGAIDMDDHEVLIRDPKEFSIHFYPSVAAQDNAESRESDVRLAWGDQWVWGCPCSGPQQDVCPDSALSHTTDVWRPLNGVLPTHQETDPTKCSTTSPSVGFSSTESFRSWIEIAPPSLDQIWFAIEGDGTGELLREVEEGHRAVSPCVASANHDKFIVAWGERETPGSSGKGKVVRVSNGAPGQVVDVREGMSLSPAIAVAAFDDGSFVLVYFVDSVGLQLVRYDAAEPPAQFRDPVTVADVGGSNATVTVLGESLGDPNARIVVVWEDRVEGDDVPFYQEFDACLNILGPQEPQPVPLPGGPAGDKHLGFSGQHTAVLRPDGQLAVVWYSDEFNGGPGNIYCTVRATTEPDPDEVRNCVDCNSNQIPDPCDLDCGPPEEDCFVDGCGLASDCNLNEIPDECEVDCQPNCIPDECDIDQTDPDGNGESSEDVNSNGIPDECELDCNENDVPDDHDIATGASEDCDANGVPDECETGACCYDGNCTDNVTICVCAGRWDEATKCEGRDPACVAPACCIVNDNGTPKDPIDDFVECVSRPSEDCLASGGEPLPGVFCDDPELMCPMLGCVGASGDCCDPEGTGSPGCDDFECCSTVCEIDAFCCGVEWDAKCAGHARDLCPACDPCTDAEGDCCDPDGNGTPGCDNADCCGLVCAEDDLCCSDEWGSDCSSGAAKIQECECTDCCFEDGRCSFLSVSGCVGQGGFPQETASVCSDEGICQLGACCDKSDGVCANGILQSNCQGPQQEWSKDTLCSDITCGCDEDGDCDDGDDCTIDTCDPENPEAGGDGCVHLYQVFADICSPFCPPDCPQPGIDDILCVLDDFAAGESVTGCPGGCTGAGGPQRGTTDLHPCPEDGAPCCDDEECVSDDCVGGLCRGDGRMNIDDVLKMLDAFAGAEPCADPCPE